MAEPGEYNGVIPSVLGELRDVARTAPADGDTLVWNATAGTWEPGAAQSGTSGLPLLTGARVASVSNNADSLDSATDTFLHWEVSASDIDDSVLATGYGVSVDNTAIYAPPDAWWLLAGYITIVATTVAEVTYGSDGVTDGMKLPVYEHSGSFISSVSLMDFLPEAWAPGSGPDGASQIQIRVIGTGLVSVLFSGNLSSLA